MPKSTNETVLARKRRNREEQELRELANVESGTKPWDAVKAKRLERRAAERAAKKKQKKKNV